MKELKSTKDEDIALFMEGYKMAVDLMSDILYDQCIEVANRYFAGRESGKLKPPPAGADLKDIGLLSFIGHADKIMKRSIKRFYKEIE